MKWQRRHVKWSNTSPTVPWNIKWQQCHVPWNIKWQRRQVPWNKYITECSMEHKMSTASCSMEQMGKTPLTHSKPLRIILQSSYFFTYVGSKSIPNICFRSNKLLSCKGNLFIFFSINITHSFITIYFLSTQRLPLHKGYARNRVKSTNRIDLFCVLFLNAVVWRNPIFY